jgi:putative hydrolase of the HAD superfamily
MKLLVWDFDGTLGYSDRSWAGTIVEVLKSEIPGFPVRPELIGAATKTGFPWHQPEKPHTHINSSDAWWGMMEPTFRRAFGATGLDPERSIALSSKVRFHFSALNRWHLFPDSLAAMDELSAAGWRHCLLSNHVPELDQILQSLGIHSRFERIANSAVTGYEKPHPKAFAAAVHSLEALDEVWMIGDSFTADFEGARRAGWNAILVRRAHGEAKPYFDDLSSAVSFLKRARRQGISSLQIRRAVESEREALEALQRRASLANAEHREALLANPDAIELPLRQITAGHVFICEQGGVIVGFYATLPRKDGGIELDGLFVEPDCWRQGVGSRLVKHCVEQSRAHGSASLHVIASPQAESFYAACGFQLIGSANTRFGQAISMRILF